MAEDLEDALRSVLERVGELARTDPTLRTRVRNLAAALLSLTEEPRPDETAPPTAAVPPLPEPVARPAPIDLLPIPAPRPVEPRLPSPPQVSDADLPLIEARCQLKAEAARWAAARQRLLRTGADYSADVEPHDRAIIARARTQPDCFLWMCHRDAPIPDDLSLFEDLAGCFEAAADATTLLRTVTSEPEAADQLEPALDLAAEAQSALRVAVGMVNRSGDYTDNDQLKLFIWLRETAAERHYLIRRHLRRDDPADAAGWPGLRERIARLAGQLRRGRDREKHRRELFKRAGYHLRRIHADPANDHQHDWHKIIETVDELIGEGLPPSNVELRDFLLPILEEIPEEIELPQSVRIALREIDRYLSLRPSGLATGPVSTPSEEVRRAAELLRGRSLVLIGGDRRSLAAESLKTALGLKDLIWIETREHQTYSVFEPYVARDDVAAVVLAIRWSSHGFGEVKEFCDKYGKPLVRLPAGYSPNQVAYHLINQVGDRLAGGNGNAAG